MRVISKRAVLVSAAVAAGTAFGVCTAASAQPRDEFFKGRTITLIIGAGAGGGIDLYGRTVARHIGRHLTGQPVVVPQNMPAAGSIAAANHLFNIAPRDGTTIGIVSQGLILDEVLGTPGLRFELDRFNWIGRISSDVLVTFTWNTSKVRTIVDAMTTEASLGGTGAGSSVSKSPMLLNRVVGTKFKVILGYTDTGATMLAMERGEVDGASTGWGGLASGKPDWIRNKKINLLLQLGTSRHRDIPDVPSWIDVAKTPDDKRLLRLFGSNADIGKSILAPPGLPPERVAALRGAFTAMVADPAFLADVKSANMDFDPASGEQLQNIVAEAVHVPDALRDRARMFSGLIGQR